jgi:hypothetical protein
MIGKHDLPGNRKVVNYYRQQGTKMIIVKEPLAATQQGL